MEEQDSELSDRHAVLSREHQRNLGDVASLRCLPGVSPIQWPLARMLNAMLAGSVQ